MCKIKLSNREITKDSMPYIIAEIGVNHEGSMEKAKELIEMAKQGGADAAKFQSYKAETLASKNSPAYWDRTKEPTLSQYELFKKHDNFWEKEFIELSEHCNKVNIDFISTPFDDDAIEFLFPLVPFYKIASADITNMPFLKKIAVKGKPVVLSTGASNLDEIKNAVCIINDSGCSELALLHCILNYPTADENANLNMIIDLKKNFPELIIGYSDHTLPDEGMISLTAAYLKGAQIIEKHFTLDKSLPGNDHYHAMDVNDLEKFVSNINRIAKLNGSTKKDFIESEKISRENARRSIVLKQNIKKGDVITENMLTCKRPAHGISPVKWNSVLGKKALTDLEEDHVLHWCDIY